MTLDPSSEPSDIIWENRGYTESERYIKRFFSLILIALMLTVSAALIYKCQYENIKLNEKYPNADCDAAELKFEDDQEEWLRISVREYTMNKELVE